MLFSQQAKRLLYKPVSLFSSSTSKYGSYHGRPLNPFNTQPGIVSPYIAFGVIGAYFGLKKMGKAAIDYISTPKKEEGACEQSSVHKPS